LPDACIRLFLNLPATANTSCKSDRAGNMNSNRGNPAPSQESLSAFEFDGRFMTAAIPVKWRGAVMLAGTIVFFPLIIGVIMLDALTHDMPSVRTPVKKVFLTIGGWIQVCRRIPRARQVADALRFSEMSRRQASLSS
jgi:hypothetical protein